MLFSRSIAQGVYVLCYLSQQEGSALSPTASIARQLHIPREQCAKILQRLAAVGLVQTRRGRGGGHALARPIERTSVGEVLQAFLGDEEPERLRPPACAGRPSPACLMHGTMVALRERVWEMLSSELLFPPSATDFAVDGDAARPRKAVCAQAAGLGPQVCAMRSGRATGARRTSRPATGRNR